MAKITFKDDNGKTYILDESKELTRGGEGKIIPINNQYVAKIYHDTSRVVDKKRMLELSPLPDTLFMKPLARLLSPQGNGFVMEFLDETKYYPLDALFSSSFAMKRNLPNNYKKIISEKIINGVKIAHDNNIIIGDLNQFNIMVNDNLDVKFIDVDSYQTPSYPHNDKLLENVRDYYFNGKVSKESDYFALSVIVFNLLTGIHPYKGFHSIYGNILKDRMINNLSIISKESKNIKIPKFYQPLSDNNLVNMFDDIFNNNQRFLISLSGVNIANVKFDGVIISNNLLFTEICVGDIINVTTSFNFMCVTTSTHHMIYNTPNKGIVTNVAKINNDVNIILTDKNIFGLKDGVLKRYDIKTKTFIEITDVNFKPREISLIKQYENILVIITNNDKMYKIYLDEYYNQSIKYTVDDVYAKSFTKHEGLYQTIGVNNMMFFNNGKTLDAITVKGNTLKDIIQCRNSGIMTNVINNKVINNLFTIDKYNNIKYGNLSDRYPYTTNDKYIILFKDDKLSFIDKETLNEVVGFDISGNYGSYDISGTNSGVIFYNKNKVLLVNSK